MATISKERMDEIREMARTDKWIVPVQKYTWEEAEEILEKMTETKAIIEKAIKGTNCNEAQARFLWGFPIRSIMYGEKEENLRPRTVDSANTLLL